MKNIITVLASLLLVMGLSGCGESSCTSQVVETMILDQPYALNIGDEIQKITPDANIEIVQNSEEDQTQYTLVVGEAQIIRQ